MLHVDHFTDPGCPFAWSAEPQRRRIAWLYGDQVAITPRMVVLADSPDVYRERGFTPERQAASFRNLSAIHGMPMSDVVRPRMAATLPACLAVVAARRHAPDSADALLRRLRVRHVVGAELLDEPDTIGGAAADVGIDPGDLRGWCEEEGTRSALHEDMAAARSPLKGALALDDKLAGPEGHRRYTCPSWVVQRDGRGAMTAPGFQPVDVYEVLIANLGPDLERREDPRSVREVLEWAGEPLAAAEVAAVCATDREDAEHELRRVAAEDDGLWSLAPRFQRDGAPA